MIHGNSNDPVNVKKIALKIWTLKDEIRDTIRKQLSENDGEVGDIQSIINEYKEGEEGASQTSSVKEESELDDSEDAMAAALADGDEKKDSEEDSSKEESSEEEDGEAAMAAAMTGGDESEDAKEGATVIQRRPGLEDNQLYHAKTLLAEIAMDRMFFFCSETFTEGTSVVIEFCVPQRFVINAEVIYCRLYNMKSRIISKNKLPYRIAVDFNFLKEGERTLLRRFLKTIEPEVYEHVDTAKMNPTDDDDDEFSELDDL